ncbi:hypothetical protein KEM48_004171 [Puccinia striiformis f. sp. tritici PST-130]|nr:hypothetical protein KEM48_004171 [Puccinia striiformis f. sp. tritici PST-130]
MTDGNFFAEKQHCKWSYDPFDRRKPSFFCILATQSKGITEEGLTKHDLPALSGSVLKAGSTPVCRGEPPRRLETLLNPSTHGEVQIGVNQLALPTKIPDNPIDTFGLVRNQFPSLIRSERGTNESGVQADAALVNPSQKAVGSRLLGRIFSGGLDDKAPARSEMLNI